jgi:Tfp pilus assembly protein PilN
MININLLPEGMRPVKRTPLPYIISVAIVVLALVGMGAEWMLLHGKLAERKDELARVEKALAVYGDVVEDAKKLEREKQALETKTEVINEVMSDRIVWSKHLWRLSTLTPDNVWYSGIAVDTRTFQNSVPFQDPKTGEPKMRSEPVKRSVLEVKGFVVPDKDGNSQINPLTFATQNDPEFRSQFELRAPKLDYADLEGLRVRTFTLEYLIKDKKDADKEKETAEKTAK